MTKTAAKHHISRLVKSLRPTVLINLGLCVFTGFFLTITLMNDIPQLAIGSSASASLEQPGIDNAISAKATPLAKNIGLFGKQRHSEPAAIVESKPMVQEKKLHLTLVGTFTDSDPTLASALISVENRPATRFFVGDVVADDIQLTSVNESSISVTDENQIRLIQYPFLEAKESTNKNRKSRRERKRLINSKSANSPPTGEVSRSKLLQKIRALKAVNDENQ